jgi:serine/threonine protein kinase
VVAVSGDNRLHSGSGGPAAADLVALWREVAERAAARLGFAGAGAVRVPVPQISPDALRMMGELGRGNFGVVRAANFFGRVVAVKQPRLVSAVADDVKGAPLDSDAGAVYCDYQLEKLVCSHLLTLPSCGHISQFLGAIEDPADARPPTLVFALHFHGDLEGYLRRHNAELAADPPLLFRWMRDMVEAVAELHGARLVHNDLFLRNFLVSRSRQVFLSDFGLLRHARCPLRDGDPVAMEYPQALLRRDPVAADVFTLARTLYKLLTLGGGERLAPSTYNHGRPPAGQRGRRGSCGGRDCSAAREPRARQLSNVRDAQRAGAHSHERGRAAPCVR